MGAIVKMCDIAGNIEAEKQWKRMLISIVALLVLAVVFVLIGDSGVAYADNDNSSDASTDLGITSMISILETIVSTLVLPIGLLLSVWRIIYLATFCGLMGIDFLGMIDDQGRFSAADVAREIKDSFWGTAKGLAWTAGVWVIFKVALSVANMLAATLDANF